MDGNQVCLWCWCNVYIYIYIFLLFLIMNFCRNFFAMSFIDYGFIGQIHGYTRVHDLLMRYIVLIHCIFHDFVGY